VNPTSSLFNAQIPVIRESNKKKVDLYPSLSVVCFHNPALTHIVDCTYSPLATPVVAPVKEIASGHAQMREINRRKCYQGAMRVQGHFGRRITVREHTTPKIKAPINTVYRSGKGCIMVEPALSQERMAVRSGSSVEQTTSIKTQINAVYRSGENSIMVERALTQERATVRSGTSINNRPFLCRPSMGKSSLHGEFCSGTGRQRVSQLHSCGPAAEGLSINTMLWGMEPQLCVN